jgi:fatty acid desaturase
VKPLLVILAICAAIALKVALVWVIVSATVSGIKALSHDCGHRYSVPIVEQDWFCVEAKS